MNIVGKVKTQTLPRNAAKDSNESNKINLYQEVPSCELSLEDFEEYALDRLKILRKMEQLNNRHVPRDKWGEHLDRMLKPFKRDAQKDEASHFILRLAFAKSEDFRRWFLAHETMLLKYRIGTMTSTATGRSTSNNSNNSGGSNGLASIVPEATLCGKKEVQSLWPKLWAATPDLHQNNNFQSNPQQQQPIYSVPFQKALDLIATRQVFVWKGKAYIPQSKLVTLVVGKFRAHLSREMAILSQVPLSRATGGAQQVNNLLSNLATASSSASEEYGGDSNDASTLSAATVKDHIRHMPLCMVQLQWGLEKDHKLKYWGRQQYGLFLKGAGLSMEDALVYFERMFTTTSDFSKQYAYNVRHMYGKEGKRKSYTAYSCRKIIHDNAPNSNEHHGCPFKHRTVAHVQAMLTKLGISNPADRAAIKKEQESHQYQLACLKHFEVTHPKYETVGAQMDNLGNHPNAWLQSSVGYASKVAPAESTAPQSKASPNGATEMVAPVSP